MSACIVDKRHIDGLVTALLKDVQLEWDATALGKMLWSENLSSIHYRYPDTLSRGNYPGPNEFMGPASVDEYVFSPLELPPLRLLTFCDYYVYQSCEHPGWKDSVARQMVLGISSKLKEAGCDLGDDDGDGFWGYSKRDEPKKAS